MGMVSVGPTHGRTSFSGYARFPPIDGETAMENSQFHGHGYESEESRIRLGLFLESYTVGSFGASLLGTYQIGRAILYTTTTQRGWCIGAFVSILARLQSPKLLPGGAGV